MKHQDLAEALRLRSKFSRRINLAKTAASQDEWRHHWAEVADLAKIAKLVAEEEENEKD